MLNKFRALFRRKPLPLASVTSRVDDSPGWQPLSSRPHDYDPAQVQELYQDALTNWRKNPIAWRIVSITTDYVVGSVSSYPPTAVLKNGAAHRPMDSPVDPINP